MPNRLQWWRDRLTHDYALIGMCIAVTLTCRLDFVSMDRAGLGHVFRLRHHSASAAVLSTPLVEPSQQSLRFCLR
jgi:hypothetical protein